MKKTYLLAGIAILCWSTVATTCKFLLNELNSIQLLWMNALIAGAFLFIMNLYQGKLKAGYKFKDYLIMTCIGLPGTFFYYIFYYSATDIMPASQAFIINYMWPVMSVICACFILKEKLTLRKIIAITVSFFGVIVVTGGSRNGIDIQTVNGAGLCIAGAVSYGIFTSLNQKMNYDKSLTLMISYFFTFCITTVINALNGALFIPGISQIPFFLWNGIFTVAVATTCWITALANGNTAKISNRAYITPFLSCVWTRIFLKEEITLNALCGLVIIVLGIFIQLKDKENSAELKNDTE